MATRRGVAAVCVFCVVAVLVFATSVKWKVVCTNYELNSYIDTLCSQWRSGHVAGSRCQDFCGGAALKPTACQTAHFGKEVVFAAEWTAFGEGGKARGVFVKAASADITGDDLHKAYTVSGGGERVYPTMQNFARMVEAYLADNMGIRRVEGGVLERLWDSPLIFDEEESEAEHVAMDSIWALVQNNEYVFSQVFQPYDIFPDVYGTCGSFYLVEKLEALPVPRLTERTAPFADLGARAKTAMKVMDLAEELDSVFEEGLLLCDVKADHFGLSEHGRVKVIDSDAVYPKSIVDASMTGDCETHSDCDYFDCKGRCDLIEGKCSGDGVVNDNLQAICDNVFLGGRGIKSLLFPGLLSSRHLNVELRKTLEHCANPSSSNDGTRIAAGDKTKKRVYDLLKEVTYFAKKLKYEESIDRI